MILIVITALTSICVAVISGTYLRYLWLKLALKRAQHDSPHQTEGPEVIIIGAGVMGAALATVLAKDGRRVTLIERSRTPPERIAGQGWMQEGVLLLEELGFGMTAESLDGFYLNKFEYHTPDGLMKHTFDLPLLVAENEKTVEALRQLAYNEKNCTFIEGSVRSLVRENGIITGVEYMAKGDSESQTLHAPLTVIADGIFSKFRAVNKDNKPVVSSYCTGIIIPEVIIEDCKVAHFLSNPLWLSIVFARGSPTATCVLMFSATPKTKESLLESSSQFPEQWRDAYKASIEAGHIKRSTAHHLPTSGFHVPGVQTMGDAACVRDPITASGMTMAMHDLILWRKLIKQIPDLYNYDALYAAENVFAMERLRYAFVTQVFAWFYRWISIPVTDVEIALAQGFGDYASANNEWRSNSIYNKMVGLREKRPYVLLYHLVCISLNAILVSIKKESLFTLPRGVYRGLAAFCLAWSLVLPLMWSELKSVIVPRGTPGRT